MSHFLNKRTSRQWLGRHARLLVLVLIVVHALSPTMGGAAPAPGGPQNLRGITISGLSLDARQAAATVYLPLVRRPAPFFEDSPIWAHTGPPAPHEVALFRRTFALAEPLVDADLVLFADTRYEAWIDGVWVGRGPARFSRQTREYDTLAVGALAAGPHTLAVAVQWAPNVRRSESTVPFLQGHIQGAAPNGLRIAAATGPRWKAVVSSAWRQDAAPVHAWGLIGPTELLDFRQLPRDWNQPAFSDAGWPAAAMATPPPTHYQPRSLSPLADVPMPATVNEVGLLSPGRAMLDLAAPSTIPFTAQAETTLTIETLVTAAAATPGGARLDQAALAWQPRADRPDVVYASQAIGPGPHTLSFPAAQGATASVSTENLDLPALSFQQGAHAGHRLLLAEPIFQPAAVAVSGDSDAGIGLSFLGAPSYAVLDLGRVVHGRVTADVTGPAGTVLDMGWDERLWQGARPLPYPGTLHPEWNQTDSWVLDGSTRSLSTIDARSGRYILIAAWGGPLQLANLRVAEERYPLVQRGGFNSTDPLLNRIWQVGVETLYPNMTDAYADPWRERGQWWGDAFVADHANQAAFGDTQLLARGLSFMAEAFEGGRPKALAPNGDGNYMLDYGMLWVQSVHDYDRQTSDAELLARIFPSLVAFAQYLTQYENATTGLLDLPAGPWPQTALIDWSAPDSRYGQSTALNALYYRTLLDAADIAARVGDPQHEQDWRKKADAVKTAINTQLYVPAEGRYMTSIYQGAAIPPSLHAQAWALANDVVPEGERQRVADALLALLAPDPAAPNIGVYGMFWVLEGLGRAGRLDDALTIIKRYYGYMLELGATTWWEDFNSYRSYASGLSHGWGTSPTWFLTTYVLGARRLGPRTWLVQPGTSSLSGVAGALPLGQGALVVRWATVGCGRRVLTIAAPADTKGAVLLSLDDTTSTLRLNGATIWRNGKSLIGQVAKQPDGLRIALGGGTYRIETRQPCDDSLRDR